jgi:hypothetical protein
VWHVPIASADPDLSELDYPLAPAMSISFAVSTNSAMRAGSAVNTTRRRHPGGARLAPALRRLTPISRGRYAGRHHGHELDIRLERQPGHVGNPFGDVADVHARLGLDRAGGLQSAARGVFVASAALPISIWPQAMLYWRPSSDYDRASSIRACSVEAKRGKVA